LASDSVGPNKPRIFERDSAYFSIIGFIDSGYDFELIVGVGCNLEGYYVLANFDLEIV